MTRLSDGENNEGEEGKVPAMCVNLVQPVNFLPQQSMMVDVQPKQAVRLLLLKPHETASRTCQQGDGDCWTHPS